MAIAVNSDPENNLHFFLQLSNIIQVSANIKNKEKKMVPEIWVTSGKLVSMYWDSMINYDWKT